MIVVAICAVLLATSRLPVLFVLLMALVMPLGGYAVDRARGGEGIRGAALAGGILIPSGYLLAFMIAWGISDGIRMIASPETWLLLILGLAWGGVVGLCAGIPRRLGEVVGAWRVSRRESQEAVHANPGPSHAARSVPGLDRPTRPVLEGDARAGESS
jgi:hypothetical protein